ncbi:MAG: hypothetical protein ABSB95_10640 [Dissulfurispiraceae bacterium]
MKRLFWVAIALIMAVFVVSCGKAVVKKVSEDSRTATEIFSIADAIKEAYINKDVLGLEKNTTTDGFKAIKSVVKAFDSAELTFNPVLIEIEEGNVTLNVSWKGAWKKGANTTEAQGMAVFVFKGMPLKLDAVLRANPFKYPE